MIESRYGGMIFWHDSDDANSPPQKQNQFFNQPQTQEEANMAKKKVSAKSSTTQKPAKRAKEKRTAPRDKQMRIEGTFDPVPDEVQRKVEEYVETLRERQATQVEENDLREEVIELMHQHNLPSVDIDDEKTLVLEKSEGEKLKIKKKDAVNAA